MVSSFEARSGETVGCDKPEFAWFSRPASSRRIHPFWFWNGEILDHELVRQVKLMDAQGVGGFFICARQGLQVPYLSKQWFRKVRTVLNAAREMGMDAWLYDEYPYPSGAAGGEVAQLHPEATHRTLVHSCHTAKGGEACRIDLGWDRILYAKAVHCDARTKMRLWSDAIDLREHVGSIQGRNVFQATGLTAYNSKRYFTADPRRWLLWTPPPGEWELHFFVEREVQDFKYFGKYIDPCNEGAVSTFIRLTHERYAREVGEYFGNTIKGFFTDETGFLGDLPWTPSLPVYFQERNGYDLRDHLHELICNQSETCRKLRYDYFQSLHELLRDRYHKVLSGWCDEHGLQYIAEAPSMRQTTQIYSHIPATDNGHEKVGLPLSAVLDKCLKNIRYNPKVASSLASQLKRERSLVECFHSVGWSMTLQDAKWMIDRLAALGVDFFNFHAFFYTTDDLRKLDAPPSLFFQNPYWEHFHLLSDYSARVSAVMGHTRPVIEIAVLDPTTSLWTRIGNPMEGFAYHGFDPSEGEELRRLKSDWDNICKTLLLGFRDYEHLDPDLLAQAEVRDKMLHLGNSHFKALVLPPLSNLERAAWDKIHEFIQAGGVVISYGLLPTERIESSDLPVREILEAFGAGEDSMADYWRSGCIEPGAPVKGSRSAVFIPSCRASSGCVPWLLSLLDEALPQDVRFSSEQSGQSFLVHQRKGSDESRFFFITNQGNSACKTKLEAIHSVGVAPFVSARQWDLETGELHNLCVHDGVDQSVIALDFRPYQSCLIEVSARMKSIIEGKGDLDTQLSSQNVLALDDAHEWDLQLENDNALRLGKFDLNIADGTAGSNLEVKPFINLCQEAGLLLGLRHEQNFGAPVRTSVEYPVDCRFKARFQVSQMPLTCRLILEEGAISGEFVIFINGHPIRHSDFQKEIWLGQDKRVYDIHSLLRSGENECVVQVAVMDDSQGLIDCLYLVGKFGVVPDRCGSGDLIAVPSRVDPFSDSYPALPFYAGTLICSRSFEMAELKGKEFIEISNANGLIFDRAMEISLNGQPLGCRAWTPYRWAVPRGLLSEEENIIEIRIVTGLEGLFEGRYFDHSAHQMRNFPKQEVKPGQ